MTTALNGASKARPTRPDAWIRDDSGRLVDGFRPPTPSEGWSRVGGPPVSKRFALGNASTIGEMLRLAEEEQLTRPFTQSSVVYACINARAQAVTAARMEVWDGNPDQDDGAEVVNDGHPLVDLLNRPNPLYSSRKLWRMASIFHSLAGGVFFVLYRKSRSGRAEPVARTSDGRVELPDEIWPVREDLMTPDLDSSTGLPTGWRFSTTDGEVVVPDHAVVHIYDQDPHNPFRGIGPLQAAFRRALVYFRSEAFDDALLANGGQVGGVLTTKQSFDEDQLNRLERSWHVNHEMPAGHKKTVILPPEMEFQQIVHKPVDMDLSGMRQWTRDEIMMVFGCTKPLLGITDDVNRANAREARRIFYENTIGPYLNLIEDEMKRAFFSVMPAEFADYCVRFNTDQIPALREDADDQVGRIDKLVEIGFSPREAAEVVGFHADLENVEHADQHWVRSTLQPVDAAIEGPPEPDPPADVDDDDERSIEMRYYSDVLHAASESETGLMAARVLYQKQFEDGLVPHDTRLAKAVKRVMDDYLLAQRRRLRDIAAGPKDAEPVVVREWEWLDSESFEWTTVRTVSDAELQQILLRNIEEWGEQLWGASESSLRGVIDDAAKALGEEVGALSFVTATDPVMVSFLQGKQVLLTEGPMSTLAQQVQRALVKGLAEGSSVGTLASRVSEVLAKLEGQIKVMRENIGRRAALIARTETTSAANAARERQMKREGIAQHEWLSSRDDLVRTIPVPHNIDGEAQTVGEPFSNGLRYPGDSERAPSAGAVANCRCTTIPLRPRDEDE